MEHNRQQFLARDFFQGATRQPQNLGARVEAATPGRGAVNRVLVGGCDAHPSW
jgi:hypothetical protein